MKYKEIIKLKRKLIRSKIPFKFVAWHKSLNFPFGKKYQILYPSAEQIVCSVIEGIGTYGSEMDLLEINSLLTEEESKYNTVKGYLSADNVYQRIKKHYIEHGGKNEK